MRDHSSLSGRDNEKQNPRIVTFIVLDAACKLLGLVDATGKNRDTEAVFAVVRN